MTHHIGVETMPEVPCLTCPSQDHPGACYTPTHRASIGDEAEMFAHRHDQAVAS